MDDLDEQGAFALLEQFYGSHCTLFVERAAGKYSYNGKRAAAAIITCAISILNKGRACERYSGSTLREAVDKALASGPAHADAPRCPKCDNDDLRQRDDDWTFCRECGHAWSGEQTASKGGL